MTRTIGYDLSTAPQIQKLGGRWWEVWTLPNGGIAKRDPEHTTRCVLAWHEEERNRLMAQENDVKVISINKKIRRTK